MPRFLKPLLLSAFLLSVLAAFLWIQSGAYHWQDGAARIHESTSSAKRKVIVLLVDSLLADSLEKVVRNNEAPALAFLLNKGLYRREMISSFPTMSVTIDSTMLTGTYADQHHVPGLLWFHPEEQRMIDYGDGLRVVKDPGVTEWLTDSFYRLNQQHLSRQITTWHEDLAAKGLTSCSINSLVYRGPRHHHFGVKGVYSLDVKGPDQLALGALSHVTGDSLPDGPFRSMGMNDEYTARSIVGLVKEKRLSDVTVAYFPDMDGELHKHGPAYLEGVRKLDRRVQDILNAFPSWEEALNQHVFILMGDSGVTKTHSSEAASLIHLERILAGFQIYRLGHKQQPDDDVAIAVNGRMSYVYALSKRVSPEMLSDRLKRDKRIDLIAWRDGDWIHVQHGAKKMSYKSGGSLRDRFDQRWQLHGDWSVMNLQRRKEDGRLFSPTYPDGLRRLESALHSHAGRFLVITARPGAEFAADGSPNHPGGGNHGSINASDSLFPFVIATNGTVPSPPQRLVDLKRYILSLVK